MATVLVRTPASDEITTITGAITKTYILTLSSVVSIVSSDYEPLVSEISYPNAQTTAMPSTLISMSIPKTSSGVTPATVSPITSVSKQTANKMTPGAYGGFISGAVFIILFVIILVLRHRHQKRAEEKRDRRSFIQEGIELVAFPRLAAPRPQSRPISGEQGVPPRVPMRSSQRDIACTIAHSASTRSAPVSTGHQRMPAPARRSVAEPAFWRQQQLAHEADMNAVDDAEARQSLSEQHDKEYYDFAAARASRLLEKRRSQVLREQEQEQEQQKE